MGRRKNETLQEFLHRIEQSLESGNYQILPELWLKGRKLTEVANEQGQSVPAMSYRLKKELEQICQELRADIKTQLGSYLKGEIFAPKRDSLLYNLLDFYLAPQRKTANLFFSYEYKDSGVFFTPKGLKEFMELRATIPNKELSINKIKELMERLKSKGYSPEVIGFLIARRQKNLPLPRIGYVAKDKKEEEIANLISKAEELYEKVDKALNEVVAAVSKLRKLEVEISELLKNKEKLRV